MKQTILGVLLLACISMQAQKKTPQHEIAFSTGYPTISFFSHQDCDPYCGDFKNAVYGKEREFGPMSLEYYHRSTDWLSVGGIFTTVSIKKDIHQNLRDGQKIGDYSERYYSLLPAVKFNLLRGEFIGIYTKVALGVCFSPESTKGVDVDGDGAKVDEYKCRVMPMYHLTLLGMEIGGRLRAFGEFGFGVKGVYNLGLRYQF